MFEQTQNFQKLGKTKDVFKEEEEEKKIGVKKIGKAGQVFQPDKNKYGLPYVAKETLRGVGEDISGVGKQIVGLGEGALSVTSGLASFVPSVAGSLVGLIGSGLGINTPKEAGELGHTIAKLGTYQPKTKEGKVIARGLNTPFDLLGRSLDWLAEEGVPESEDYQEIFKIAGATALVVGGGLTGKAKLRWETKIKPKVTKSLAKIKGGKKLTTSELRATETAIREVVQEPTPTGVIAAKKRQQSLDHMSVLYDRSVEMSKKSKQQTLGGVKAAAEKSFIDTSGNIKSKLLKHGGKEANAAVVDHTLSLGATPASQFSIDTAINTIYKGLSKEQTKSLDSYIFSARTKDILSYKPKHKRPGGQTMEQALDVMAATPKAIKQRAEAYFSEYRKINDLLLEEGVIDVKARDVLNSHVYNPTKYFDYLDPELKFTFGEHPNFITDSGIKRLKEGSYGLTEMGSQKLLTDAWNRAYGRVFRNRAFQSLYDFAVKNPENNVARTIKASGSVRPGFAKLKGRVKGKKKAVVLPTQMAEEWVRFYTPQMSHTAANWVGWLSGSKVLKPMATGLNPFFALANVPRDIAHIWLTTKEYSSSLPITGMQMARDLSSTVVDAVKRKGAFKDYVNEGGGMSFLTHQGAITKKASGALGKIQQALGFIGETSEIHTRLMLRQRALRNGASPKEATFIARNYLDFNQGGAWSRYVDKGVPYLNAGIQGTRGLTRAAGSNPGLFTWKIAQIGLMAAGLREAGRLSMGEHYDQIPSDDKQRNWIIPTPLKFTDKQGNKRGIYFKIAKDQGQRLFASLFESGMKIIQGDDVDTDDFVAGVADALPLLPGQNIPPTLDALLGYTTNIDLFKGEEIWKGEGIKAKEEWTEYTPEIYKTIGKYTGMSPEKMKYAFEQLVTAGNIYTSVLGAGTEKLFNASSSEYEEKHIIERISRYPGVKRLMGITRPYEEFAKEKEELEKEHKTKKLIRSRNIDSLSKEFWGLLKETGELNTDLQGKIRESIKQAPDYDRERLFNRFQRSAVVYNLPQRRWWLTTAAQDPELRAQVFFARWEREDEKTQQRMYKISKLLSGFSSERFRTHLGKIISKYEK